MAKKLAQVLKTDIMGTIDLPSLAKIVQSKGRKGDTVLAHITRKEAEMLKRRGGAGTINPETGLPEFYGEDLYGSYEPPIYTDTSSGTFPQATDSGVYVAETPGQAQQAELLTGQVAPEFQGASQGQLLQSPEEYLRSAGLSVGPSGFRTGSDVYVDPASQQIYDSVFNQQAAGFRPGYLDQVAAAGGAVGGGRGVAGEEQAPKDIGTAVQKAADATGKTEEEKSTLEKLLSGKSALGLGILGAGGLMGYMNQQRAAEQAKNAAAQIQAAYAQAAQSQKELAQPLIGPGYTQLSQALQGALSPANTQAFQAAQARAAQASARSGGVGAVQTALQEEALRQQLLASQQQQALNLIAPGNAMIQAAINAQLQGTTQSLGTRLQLEQAANQAAMNLYSSLGTAIGGGLLKG